MRSWPAQVERAVATALHDGVSSNAEPDPASRRRRIVVVATLVIGTTLLGLSLAAAPGSAAFYPLTLGVAATWTIGGLVSGPLHLGRLPSAQRLRRPVVVPIVIGLAVGAVFVVGALIVREIGPLRDYVESVLAHARKGSLPLVAVVTLVTGAAEEVFFRGALYAAVGRRRPVLVTTVVYTLVTIATGNPMLVFAAAVVGVVLGLERRVSGGILAPVLTHITWSAVMLFALPPLLH